MEKRPDASNDTRDRSVRRERRLVEGVDFYFERGLMVLTEKFLLDRGYCCGNGCRHCPYTDSDVSEAPDK